MNAIFKEANWPLRLFWERVATYTFIFSGVFVLNLTLSTKSWGQNQDCTYTIYVNDLGDQPDEDLSDGVCDAGDGRCTLRAAIETFNSFPYADLPDDIICIAFRLYEIPGPNGQERTIKLNSPLPAITGVVNLRIKGYDEMLDGQGIWTFIPYVLDGNGIVPVGLQLAGTGVVQYEVNGFVNNNFTSHGISITGVGGHILAWLTIGLDFTGSFKVGNGGDGIHITSPNNTITSSLISGNEQSGIRITGPNAYNNKIIGNKIGTDKGGKRAIANTYGVFIDATAYENIIGGALANQGNLLSGNTKDGVLISYFGTQKNKVKGNKIGVDDNGNGPLPNEETGVLISTGARLNEIGGEQPGEGNVISFNGLSGVGIIEPTTDSNSVIGNSIGVDVNGNPAGNSSNGVTVSAGARFNTISKNSIDNNGKLGIDLEDNGVTLNDINDPDAGSNDLQNFPMPVKAIVNGGNINVAGIFNSTPNTSFKLEFFHSPACDPSGFGEGRTFIGQIVGLQTNDIGNANFNAIFQVAVPLGHFITATATDPYNNTSEFSPCIETTSDGGPPPFDSLEYDLAITKVSTIKNLVNNKKYSFVSGEVDTLTLTVKLLKNEHLEGTDEKPVTIISVRDSMITDIPLSAIFIDTFFAIWNLDTIRNINLGIETGPLEWNYLYWNMGTQLFAGDSIRLVIVSRVNQPGVLINKAQIIFSDLPKDDEPINDQDSILIEVQDVISQADLEITQAADKNKVLVGDPVTLTIRLVNNGPATATNIVVTDSVLTAIRLNAVVIDNLTASKGVFSRLKGVYTMALWTIPSLEPGEEATLTISGRSSRPGNLTNKVEVTASEQPDPDSDAGNWKTDEDDFSSITIEVLPISTVTDLIKQLITRVDVLVGQGELSRRQGNTLKRYLKDAIKLLAPNKKESAIASLNGFIAEVTNLVNNKQLDEETGQSLIADALFIINKLQPVPDINSGAALSKKNDNVEEVSSGFTFYPPAPNPLYQSTELSFKLSHDSRTSLIIYDMNGVPVATLVNEVKSAGYHRVIWYSGNVTSGVYIAQLKVGNNIKFQKMVLIR